MQIKTEKGLRAQIQKLKRALKENAQSSEARYRTIFENIQDVYYEASLEGILLELSPSISAVSGYTREKLIGTSLYNLYANPGEREVIVDKIRTLGKISDYEIGLKDADGTFLPCSITSRLIVGRSGAPEKICGILRVITERKRIEKALAESESLYRTLVEQSPISIARVGRDGKFVFVNKQFLCWAGLLPEQVIGQGPEIFTGLMTPEMFQTMTNAVGGTLMTGEKTECELMFNTNHGGRLWIMQLAYPWRGADGAPLGIEIQGYDITKRKQAEEILKESSETFSRIFNLGPLISVITTLAEGRFIEVNDAFVKITGYGREEIIGKSSSNLKMIPPEVREKANRNLLKNGFSITESGVRLKSGEVRTGLFYARPIMLQGEACQLQTVIDITDLKKGQEALRQSNRELEMRVRERTAELSRINAELQKEIEERKRAEEQRRIAEEQLQHSQRMESLGVLAGGIAHDFNNLLAGIFGTISLAKLNAPAHSETAELLDQTLALFSRAKDLTQQLLTFSKGGHPLKKVQFLDPVLRDTVKFAMSGSDIAVDFRIGDGLWPCDIDENQIGQVIENIIINARQAMPTGGTISITGENISLGEPLPTALKNGAYVKVAIRDAGSGIAPEHLAHIFDPFFTTKQKGSGLGLATAYSIIKKHGGLLGVDSALGKGALFYFYIPAVPGFEPPELAEIASPAPAHGAILIMDDENYIRMLMEKTLGRAGYAITTVADGRAAVEVYKNALHEGRPFDLAVLDLTVPGGMGGQKTLEELLRVNPHVKALAASGYSKDPVMADPGAFGFCGRLIKPFTIGELTAALQKALATAVD
ncbi:MAG: PAS domain S-box protein [Chitinivibrionales bacterium]|nr:PAS domain S-box protein [Chitinivibrionales bacterium]